MATDTSSVERTLGQLVADASHDVEGIVRSEIALAKAEMLYGARFMGKGAALLCAAAFLALLGLIFLFHTLAAVLAIWLPVWAGYLIVTAVLLGLAGLLALVGKNALTKASPSPEKAIAEAQQTIAALKR
jgi:protein-S-isoprenylcysteine O-methyltransferase Ste14